MLTLLDLTPKRNGFDSIESDSVRLRFFSSAFSFVLFEDTGLLRKLASFETSELFELPYKNLLCVKIPGSRQCSFLAALTSPLDELLASRMAFQ